MTDPFTFHATTEYTSSLMEGWWLVLEDTYAHPDDKHRAFSIPINGSEDTGDILYPLLGVGWRETEQIAPRKLTERVLYQAAEYALQQAVSRGKPLSETALNLLNWLHAASLLRTT